MPTGRQRKMKGGFLDSLTQVLTDAYDKTKKATGDAYNSAIGVQTTPSYTASSNTAPSYPVQAQSNTQLMSPPPSSQYPSTGGKNKGRKRSRKMRGGYSDNISLTGLAASAAPISDIRSAQPLNIVGGKRRTKKCRRYRNSKSCKRRRQ
jgi:hypothetical protein